MLEPAGEWVPRPYQSPGHTSYCGTRLTRRVFAGHILEQPPRRWAHQARSLGPSLPSTSLDPLSRPQSRLPRPASHPIHCPPRSPLPARLTPHSLPASIASPGPSRSRIPFVLGLAADGCHPLAYGSSLLASGYHSLVKWYPHTPFIARLGRFPRPGPSRSRPAPIAASAPLPPRLSPVAASP